MKIIFMGTPDFSCGCLEALIYSGHEITAVVTQPDKPKGRSKQAVFSPVKECALRYKIPVLQPVKIRLPESVEELKKYPADIYIVAAFGQILSQEILDIPKYGCVCVHASLLPKYRGAAPIQWALIDGEEKTGITIMQMDAGIDTGDMLLKQEVLIEPSDTGDSLFEKLKKTGAKLMIQALLQLEQGTLKGEPQNNEESSYTKMLTKSVGRIDWEKPACQIERLIRALNSWPSAYTMFRGKIIKIWEASLSDDTDMTLKAANTVFSAGTVAGVTKDAIFVNTGDGLLKITSVQLEGKKRVTIKEFLSGYQIKPGERLGGITI